MRERLDKRVTDNAQARITPAYAGKTCVPLFPYQCDWDHPRVCGKDNREYTTIKSSKGSPPRMRERLKPLLILSAVIRITPAYAGKTIGNIPQSKVVKDHPRVCGKDRCLGSHQLLNQGSPPRMRERLNETIRKRRKPRITPAYAGKTWFNSTNWRIS